MLLIMMLKLHGFFIAVISLVSIGKVFLCHHSFVIIIHLHWGKLAVCVKFHNTFSLVSFIDKCVVLPIM